MKIKMKWAALAALVAAVAVAGPTTLRVFTESVSCSGGTCTRSAAPTLSTHGMDLAGVTFFRVSVCAASGQTLVGGGTMQAWVYNASQDLWQRNPGLDLSVSVTSTSCAAGACRCQAWPDLEVGQAVYGRTLYYPNAITVSAGSAIESRIDAMYGRR